MFNFWQRGRSLHTSKSCLSHFWRVLAVPFLFSGARIGSISTWVIRIEDYSRAFSKRVFHDRKADETGAKAVETPGREEGEWKDTDAGADAGEDVKRNNEEEQAEEHDQDEEGRAEEHYQDKDDVRASDFCRATAGSTKEVRVCDAEGKAFDKSEAEDGRNGIGWGRGAHELQKKWLAWNTWIPNVKDDKRKLAEHFWAFSRSGERRCAWIILETIVEFDLWFLDHK